MINRNRATGTHCLWNQLVLLGWRDAIQVSLKNFVFVQEEQALPPVFQSPSPPFVAELTWIKLTEKNNDLHRAAVHGEKAIAPHSSTHAWKIPWMEEPGGLQSNGVAKSRTRLSDFTFTFHFHAWEKEMASHSSFLAWRIPGMGEPGGLPSMGSHRVGHDRSDLAVAP